MVHRGKPRQENDFRSNCGLVIAKTLITEKAANQPKEQPSLASSAQPTCYSPMKLLFDFFPILLFFIAYKMFDIYVATAAAIAATFLQIAITWIKTRTVPSMQWVTLVVIIIFGGLTLYLRDEQFIKWKPTVINWLFGAAFLASHFWGEQTAIERMLSSNLTLPQPVWRRLNFLWVAFFLAMGAANLYVMSYFDRDTWVNFKLFGMLGLTLVFIVLQSLYLSRYMTETDSEGKE
jgi:intracellular septation protein